MLRVALIVGLVLMGALVGALTNFAPLYLAIPIGLIVLVSILLGRGWETDHPDGEPDRNRLGARRQRFTARDRETLT